jgi:hypothetical protein
VGHVGIDVSEERIVSIILVKITDDEEDTFLQEPQDIAS